MLFAAELGRAGVNLHRALEIRPEFARAHINLGLLLARTYHESEALAEFSKAGCDEATARSNLAFALTLEERYRRPGGSMNWLWRPTPARRPPRRGSPRCKPTGLPTSGANTAARKSGVAATGDGIRLAAADPTGPPPPGSVTPPVVQASLVSPDIQRF